LHGPLPKGTGTVRRGVTENRSQQAYLQGRGGIEFSKGIRYACGTKVRPSACTSEMGEGENGPSYCPLSKVLVRSEEESLKLTTSRLKEEYLPVVAFLFQTKPH